MRDFRNQFGNQLDGVDVLRVGNINAGMTAFERFDAQNHFSISRAGDLKFAQTVGVQHQNIFRFETVEVQSARAAHILLFIAGEDDFQSAVAQVFIVGNRSSQHHGGGNPRLIICT